MNISKDSWHYKIVSFIFDKPEYNFCNYFWKVVWSLFLVCVFFLMIFVAFPYLLGLCIGQIAHDVFGFSIVLEHTVTNWWLFVPFAYITYIVSALLVFGFIHFFFEFIPTTIRNYKEKRLNQEIENPKEPGIVGTFIKAKKGKYCPRISYIDKDEKSDG